VWYFDKVPREGPNKFFASSFSWWSKRLIQPLRNVHCVYPPENVPELLGAFCKERLSVVKFIARFFTIARQEKFYPRAQDINSKLNLAYQEFVFPKELRPFIL
jgi:hypothetical protein